MNDGWELFLSLCLKTKSKKDLDQLFKLMCTHEERESIDKRMLIVKELIAGEKTQREIAKENNLSISKITRGSNALKIIDEKLIHFLRGNCV